MRTVSFVCLFGGVWTIVLAAMGQGPSLKLDPNGSLEFLGRTGNYYRISQSTNLIDWYPASGSMGQKFMLLSSPTSEQVNMSQAPKAFFRAEAFVSVTNGSYKDDCAEHDSVNVKISGGVSGFLVIATHPTNYVVSDYTNCMENFSNCVSECWSNYPFSTNELKKDYDGLYVIANRDEIFWRSNGMTVTCDGLPYFEDNIHYIEIGNKILGVDEYPQYFVLYCDGYMRLIPFPPMNHKSVCFGSSVLIGPAVGSRRPYADIESVDFRSVSKTLFIKYRAGGTAILDFGIVSRTNATVKVIVDYATDQSFCTLRSVYVADGNSDCDYVSVTQNNGVIYHYPIMSFTGGDGIAWFFHRRIESIQRQSAPDIAIIPF